MTLCMLGSSYIGVDDPTVAAKDGNGLTRPERLAEARRWLDLLLTHGRQYVDTIVSQDPTVDTQAYRAAVQEYEQAGFIERNQTLIVGLGIIGGLAVLAAMAQRQRK